MLLSVESVRLRAVERVKEGLERECRVEGRCINLFNVTGQIPIVLNTRVINIVSE